MEELYGRARTNKLHNGTAPRVKRHRSHSRRKLNCGSKSCFATHFRNRLRRVVFRLSLAGMEVASQFIPAAFVALLGLSNANVFLPLTNNKKQDR